MVKQLTEYNDDDIETQLLLLFDGSRYYHHEGISVYEYLILGGEIYKVKQILNWPQDFSNGVLSMLLWRMFITEHKYSPIIWLNFYRDLPAKISKLDPMEDLSNTYFKLITGSDLYKSSDFMTIEYMDPDNLHSTIIYMKESLEKIDLYAAYADLMTKRPIFEALVYIDANEPESLMKAQKEFGMVSEEIKFDYDNIVNVLLDYEKGNYFAPEGGYFRNTYNPKIPLAFSNQDTARWLGLNRNVYHHLRDAYTRITMDILSNKFLEDKWYYYDTYGDYKIAYGKAGNLKDVYSIKDINRDTHNLRELQQLLLETDNDSDLYRVELDRVISILTSSHSGYNTPKIIPHSNDYINKMIEPFNKNKLHLLGFVSVCYLYIYFAMGLKQVGNNIIFDKEGSYERTVYQQIFIQSLATIPENGIKDWAITVPLLNENEQSLVLTGTSISNLYDLAINTKICVIYKGYYLHWVARKLLLYYSSNSGISLQNIIKDWMEGPYARSLIPDAVIYPFKNFNIDLEKINIII